MAHIYLLFDFARDEEKAQQARHKLEGWKQAFRLDKKLLYKMERTAAESPGDGAAAPPEPESKTEKSGKSARGSKTKTKAAAKSDPEPSAATDEIKLLVRLAFSGHEKLSEQRWLQRLPAEEPFQAASPKVVKAGEPEFEATEKQFDELA